MTSHGDLCVIGAGLLGTLTALQAARAAPAQSVVLLDAQTAGRGAIHVSSALLLGFAFDAGVREMTRRSAAFYRDTLRDARDVIEEFPFYWSVSPGYAKALHTACTEALQPVSQDQMAALPRPAWSVPDLPDKRYFRQTGLRAHPVRLHDHLLAQFLALPNARLIEGFRARAMTASGNGLRIDSDTATIHAGKAVASLGPWISRSPFAEDAADHAVRVKKVVSFHIPFDHAVPDAIGQGFLEEEVYIAPEHSKKRYIVSITSREWDVSPEDGTFAPSPDDLTVYEAALRRLGLTAPQPLSASVFADAYAPDGLPRVLCPDRLAGRLAICTATSGYGVKVGPALAAQSLSAIGIKV